MANFKQSNQGNDWPSTSTNKVVDNDPMIVRVPLDEVEFGSRKSTMANVRNQDGFKENKMDVKHVPDANKGAA